VRRDEDEHDRDRDRDGQQAPFVRGGRPVVELKLICYVDILRGGAGTTFPARQGHFPSEGTHSYSPVVVDGSWRVLARFIL
jgi:hypothetical protein